MPLQSGSDRVLKAMRRSYRQERYLGIIDRVRAAMPDAAITTDIIVGFPGETEDDFAQTLDVVRAARFAGAFTFQYSKRPGTPAATCPTRCRRRSCRSATSGCVALQEEISWAGEQAPGRPRRSRSWWPRARAARTARPTGCPAAPRTTAWCTSPSRPASSRRGPATSPPSRSPTPPRTTWSPTARSAGSAGPGPATPGRPVRAVRRSPAGVLLGMPTVGAPPAAPAVATTCG